MWKPHALNACGSHLELSLTDISIEPQFLMVGVHATSGNFGDNILGDYANSALECRVHMATDGHKNSQATDDKGLRVGVEMLFEQLSIAVFLNHDTFDMTKSCHRQPDRGLHNPLTQGHRLEIHQAHPARPSSHEKPPPEAIRFTGSGNAHAHARHIIENTATESTARRAAVGPVHMLPLVLKPLLEPNPLPSPLLDELESSSLLDMSVSPLLEPPERHPTYREALFCASGDVVCTIENEHRARAEERRACSGSYRRPGSSNDARSAGGHSLPWGWGATVTTFSSVLQADTQLASGVMLCSADGVGSGGGLTDVYREKERDEGEHDHKVKGKNGGAEVVNIEKIPNSGRSSGTWAALIDH
ncbi:hypothetical protein DFH09DRAFT_1094368 [Mycena vulgaris]|nr:hypothetical protein DFH09DRAFT_1094368 [Mycena vulgaris]